MTECIHGLDGQQCDVCFPQKLPEKPVAVRAAAPRKTAEVRPARVGTSVKSRRPVAEQRVYHVTHVRNLEGILADGELRAEATPAVSLYSELGLELRHTAEVSTGRTVSEFVAFAITPDSHDWSEIRAGAHEPGWSAAVRGSAPTDFVFLISTIGTLGEVTVADGDAAGSLTRFASEPGDVRRMLDRMTDYPELGAAAEVLVDGSVPLASIRLVGVANEPAKERVRAILAGSGFSPRIAVYPPWFAQE